MIHMNTTASTQVEIGEWLKTRGMAKAWENSAANWRELFSDMADTIADVTGSVTAEEVVGQVGFPPGNRNAIGAAMSKWAKRRQAVPTYEKSQRPSRHAAITTRWHLPR